MQFPAVTSEIQIGAAQSHRESAPGSSSSNGRVVPEPGGSSSTTHPVDEAIRNAKSDEPSSSFVNESEEETSVPAMEKQPNSTQPKPPHGNAAPVTATSPAPTSRRGGPRTFEVLEISDNDAEDFDDDLHLTEYELEQQHQQEEEGRKLLQSLSADSGDDRRRPNDANGLSLSGRSATCGGDENGQLPRDLPPPSSSPRVPSVPARVLHAIVRVFLRGERATAPQRVGNVSIFAPSLWLRTGWGTIGPHWFGPAVIVILTVLSGHFFLQQASRTIGPISAFTCAAFTVATLFHLANVALRDPGVVNTRRYHHTRSRPVTVAGLGAAADLESPAVGGPPDSEPSSPEPLHNRRARGRRERERWCDYCQAMQPPDGAHCLDCGVCVAGYDHHCVWMGTCIGASNFKQFVRFNLCWLAFLGYSILWVTLVGPRVF